MRKCIGEQFTARRHVRTRAAAGALILGLTLAACATPTPPSPTPPPTYTPTLPHTAVPSGSLTPTPLPPGTPAPLPTSAPTAPPLTPPRAAQLTLCLAEEPRSLYQFAQPDAGRAHVLAALYDGPVDRANFGYQPALLERLPALGDGVEVRTARVAVGDSVVNSLGLIVPLAEGTELTLLGGELYTHTGAGPADLPQMVVTFRLRGGVTWSDGAPLSAHDSVFAFQVARSPDAFDPRGDLADRTLSYTAPDDLTLVWTGLPGYLDPDYLDNLWTPLPRHRFAGLRSGEIADSDEARFAPLGWGPFVVESWARGDRLVLARNPGYWRAAEGLPRIERLVYRFFATPAALADALRAGECDVAPSGAGLTAALLVDPALAAASLGFQQVDGDLLEFLYFGLLPAEDYARPGGADLFQDPNVRRAFAYCLGRGARLSPVPWVGAGEPSVPAAYLPAAHPLYAADAARYGFNPETGRGWLAVAGWADSDGDGLLDRDGAGRPLALILAGGPEGNARRAWLMNELARQWRSNCALDVALRPLTRGELEADWPDGVLFGRRFDLALLGWRVGAAPPCVLFTRAELPSALSPGGANAAGYASPAFDEACRRALSTLDPAQSAAYHAEAQRLFAEDLPAIPLFAWPRLGAARAQVSGYQLDANSESELWNVEEWIKRE